MKNLLLGALALASSTTASAATYQLGYQSGYGNFTGTVQTSGTADAQGYFAITGLVGTHDGNAVTLLPSGSYFNDNLFSPASPYLDSLGLSYSALGTRYNVFSVTNDDGTQFYDEISRLAGSTVVRESLVTGFTVTAATAPVPEPATWTMLIAGFALVGAAARRRATRPVAAVA